MVELGIWEHYRGGRYEVVMNALLENNEEPAVVYRALYENDKSEYWIRTEQDFLAEVEVDGQLVPRFKLVESYGKDL